MPFVQINVPAGSLDADHKRDMIAKVTDAVVAAEGIEAVRRNTWVQILEVPDGGWGMAYHVPRLAAQPLLIWLALWTSKEGRVSEPDQVAGSASTE